jgi:hypothetical protein
MWEGQIFGMRAEPCRRSLLRMNSSWLWYAMIGFVDRPDVDMQRSTKAKLGDVAFRRSMVLGRVGEVESFKSAKKSADRASKLSETDSPTSKCSHFRFNIKEILRFNPRMPAKGKFRHTIYGNGKTFFF